MEWLLKVVAAEADESRLRLYFHEGTSFRCEERPFSPFFVAAEELEGAERLAGDLPLCWKVPGANAPAGVVARTFREPRCAALSISGIRLFEGMEFGELRRMQFIVSADEKGAVTRISCADSSGWYDELVGSEAEIITAFTEEIRRRDPDVLEGFDFFRNDWEILKKRAAKNKIPLDCGRGGKPVTVSRSRMVIGERQINFPRYECPGRHLIDVFLVLQLHDVAKREMESYELEAAAEHFKLPAAHPAEQIGALSAILTPAYFYCTRFIPESYQSVTLRGNGSKIDLLFTGAYLERGHSLPLPEGAVFFPGATSRAELTGFFAPVWHCDVRSLYPSILLAEELAPARDELRLFPVLLRQLRQKRLEAKDRARASSGTERDNFNALQNALKIVINSFYGYLGFAQGSFNDYALASKVTAKGREILDLLAKFLDSAGAKVIEMDTDGLYFVPPQGALPDELAKKIQGALPTGIEIELDAVYPAMISYKAKNYALLTAEGEVELTGAALKSRGMELWFRRVLKEIFRLRLTGQEGKLEELRERSRRELLEHAVPLKELCKNETLNDTPANYRKKLESSASPRRSAVYELLLEAGVDARSGDKISFYITGDKAKVAVVENSKLLRSNQGERDENLPYYLQKLEELFASFGK